MELKNVKRGRVKEYAVLDTESMRHHDFSNNPILSSLDISSNTNLEEIELSNNYLDREANFSDEYSFVDDLVLPYRNLYYYKKQEKPHSSSNVLTLRLRPAMRKISMRWT
ncbi:hypothetical protein N9Y89_02225 [bacterium]|nr:hypothetical protein [bacterium]